MEIRVLGWSYENIRGGLRDVSVELGSPLPRWTLIQMPNGTGKTTTMALSRLCSPRRLFPLKPFKIFAQATMRIRDSSRFASRLMVGSIAYSCVSAIALAGTLVDVGVDIETARERLQRIRNHPSFCAVIAKAPQRNHD